MGLPKQLSYYILAGFINQPNEFDYYDILYFYLKEYENAVSLLKIISNDRPNIITQKDTLETDLQNMEIADEEYDKDPKEFKTSQFDSLPDIKRCSFIRKHKNKYKRCSNGILNDDSDMCYKHLDSFNMYWDKWCEILENIRKH